MSNKEEFENLYGLYFKKVYSYFSICFNSFIAEDLSQQTFLKLWKYLKYNNYCEPQSWKAWIFRVAINVKNDFLRSKQIAPKEFEYSESIDSEYFVSDITLDTIAIKQAFGKLSMQEKELLTLKSFGLTSKEIGILLNVSDSTIRSRLSVAKNLFKKYLNNCGVICDE
jgi:RNA polymerase sigma factor (sigma-70 family)